MNSLFLQVSPGHIAWHHQCVIHILAPQGTHGEDLLYYFGPWVSPTMGDYLNTTWIIFSVYGGSRTYDNANFVQAFNQSFINVILSLDPNKKFDPTDRTPPWRNWSSDHTEMLFNETAAGDPDIRAVSTDPSCWHDASMLLRVCGWHCMILTFIYL